MAGDRLWRNHCCPTAARAPGNRTGGYSFLQVLQVKKRADERTRTADLLITSELILLVEQSTLHQLGLERIYRTVTTVKVGTICVDLVSNSSGYRETVPCLSIPHRQMLWSAARWTFSKQSSCAETLNRPCRIPETDFREGLASRYLVDTALFRSRRCVDSPGGRVNALEEDR